ncbi:hypothetical protein MW887_011537 [Aspergillus wentii]|nr:hypothetical protein MW887_011537 [Aspergillus wentii]
MFKQYLCTFLLFWFSLVSAQDKTSSSPATTSTSSAIQTVDVGEDGLTFKPDTINVAPGGKVEFHFYPGSHGVAEASFTKPCHPLSDTSFFSGFIDSASGESTTVFTLTVNNTDPIWYYCPRTGHCEAGMVGVINPPTAGPDSLDAFRSAASNANGDSAPANVQGGIVGPSNPTETTTSASATSTTTSGSATTTTTGSPTPTATNVAGKLLFSTEIDIVFILTLVEVIFMLLI